LFPHVLGLLLLEELANQLPFLFILNAGKKFRSQSGYCLGTIKRQFVVNLSALKVARLTPGLKYRFDFRIEIMFLVCTQ